MAVVEVVKVTNRMHWQFFYWLLIEYSRSGFCGHCTPREQMDFVHTYSAGGEL